MSNRRPKLPMIPLVIWGASGHAKVVADIVRSGGNFDIIGFLDSIDASRKGTAFCGSTILGGEEQLEILYKRNVKHLIFGFGNCQARLTLAPVVNSLGFELATAIHPNATVAKDVRIGQGTVVMAGAVINPGSTVRENVIINTSASVDHDCVIANAVHVGPGAHIGGGVTIGQSTWIGIGAIVKDKIRIGDGSIIGAGAVVLRDIPDGVVAFGVPAKVIRKMEK